MDGQRFDQVARVVGASASRRAGLRLLAAAALGGLGGRLGFGGAVAQTACGLPGERCKKGADCCSRRCTKRRRPQRRRKRTGKCTECRGGTSLCAGGCHDLQTDEAHCGECGNACPTGGRCIEGDCFCRAGFDDVCGGACVDTDSDPNHCGRCGRSCGAEETCEAGGCVKDGCPSGWRRCDGECRDVQTDEAHCGECGNACPDGARCLEGACFCPRGGVVCGGVCTDIQGDSDDLNCGGCDIRCDVTSEFCCQGRCKQNTAASPCCPDGCQAARLTSGSWRCVGAVGTFCPRPCSTNSDCGANEFCYAYGAAACAQGEGGRCANDAFPGAGCSGGGP